MKTIILIALFVAVACALPVEDTQEAQAPLTFDIIEPENVGEDDQDSSDSLIRDKRHSSLN